MKGGYFGELKDKACFCQNGGEQWWNLDVIVKKNTLLTKKITLQARYSVVTKNQQKSWT